jgi:hypothetical protein
MSPRTIFSLVLVLASAAIAQNSSKSESQLQPPAPRVVDFKTPDGVVFKGTYFAAKPGPGVILYHQSNRTRESWSAVAGWVICSTGQPEEQPDPTKPTDSARRSWGLELRKRDCIEGCNGECIHAVGSLAGAGGWSITNVTALYFPSPQP